MMKELKVIDWREKFDPMNINQSRIPEGMYIESFYYIYVPEDEYFGKCDMHIDWEMKGGYKDEKELTQFIDEIKRAYRENGCSGIVEVQLYSYMDPGPYEVFKFRVDSDTYKKVHECVSTEHDYGDLEDED